MRPTIDDMFPPRAKRVDRDLLNHRSLAARGWSKSMIATFLPTCDETAPNPHHRRGLPMQLYRLDRVREAERHPEFAVRLARAAKRSSALKPSVERRREMLLRHVETIDLELPRLERSELVRTACRQNNQYWESKDRWDRRVTPNDSQVLLDRVCVNYLFYECAAYRLKAELVLGSVGAADARLIIARKALEGIAETYPFLASECDRQYFRRLEKTEMLDTRPVLGFLVDA